MTPVNGSPPNSDSDQPSDKLSGKVIAVIAVLVATAFVMMLNETALSVALPDVMEEFDITASVAQWALTGVMLTMAIVMPMTGWILDRFTTRQVYFFAVIFFLIGSIVAALSPTFMVMFLGRVLQAVGTAIVMPLQMTVVMNIVPPHRRGSIMGIISIVMAVGPALGPTFAGLIMSFSTWHMTFWIMAVLVAIAGLVAMRYLQNVGTTKESPLDFVSVVLSAFAFGGLVYGLSSIGMIVTGAPGATAAIVISIVGVVGLILFIWRQLATAKSGKALLNLAPLKVKNFVVAVIVIMAFQMALLGVSNTLPLYLQGALLVSVLVAGMVNLPGGIVETLISPISGALYDRIGPRPLVIPGALIAAGSLYAMATTDHTTSVWFIVVMFAILSIGIGLALTPLMTTSLSSLPGEIYTHGSAIMNTLMQLAGAAGTAVMIAIFDVVSAAGGGTPEAQGEGGSRAFLVAAILLSVAFVFSLFIQRPDLSGSVKTVEPAEPK
ncbi:DHA2 family efflux MFS transporter permease subunit [Corynebacterium lubricantis]|uniref:DHA2 family efflux MFS transporter permease subunit n=1 Tax=Corynebacterium lubricantis TaxID=541095 RepID=UPI0003633DE4|nr:DHA2 family efflux MFS transporter permease subunit [Corynebacterium lubricantis]